jgi:hypothetical protein
VSTSIRQPPYLAIYFGFTDRTSPSREIDEKTRWPLHKFASCDVTLPERRAGVDGIDANSFD